MILTIVATVSERHALPNHDNTKTNPVISSYEAVRVLHIYISIFLYNIFSIIFLYHIFYIIYINSAQSSRKGFSHFRHKIFLLQVKGRKNQYLGNNCIAV